MKASRGWAHCSSRVISPLSAGLPSESDCSCESAGRGEACRTSLSAEAMHCWYWAQQRSKWVSHQAVIWLSSSQLKMQTECGGRNRLCLTSTSEKYLKLCSRVSHSSQERSKTWAAISRTEESFWKGQVRNSWRAPWMNSAKRSRRERRALSMARSLEVQGSKIISMSARSKDPRYTSSPYIFSVNFLSPKNAEDSFFVISYIIQQMGIGWRSDVGNLGRNERSTITQNT